jgi:hypothetical protein
MAAALALAVPNDTEYTQFLSTLHPTCPLLFYSLVPLVAGYLLISDMLSTHWQ